MQIVHTGLEKEKLMDFLEEQRLTIFAKKANKSKQIYMGRQNLLKNLEITNENKSQQIKNMGLKTKQKKNVLRLKSITFFLLFNNANCIDRVCTLKI